jgi:hypothetical protein
MPCKVGLLIRLFNIWKDIDLGTCELSINLETARRLGLEVPGSGFAGGNDRQ